MAESDIRWDPNDYSYPPKKKKKEEYEEEVK